MLDYKRVAAISSRIVECDNAMEKLKEMGDKLAKSKGNLDVEIIIEEELVKPKFEKKEDEPIVIIATGSDIFNKRNLANEVFAQEKHEKYESKRDGLAQKGMPNELALVMLDSMQNYYKRQKQYLEYLIIQELAKLNIEELSKAQQLE